MEEIPARPRGRLTATSADDGCGGRGVVVRSEGVVQGVDGVDAGSDADLGVVNSSWL
jgi:hypothetical protein